MPMSGTIKSTSRFDAFTRSDAGNSKRSIAPGLGVFYTKEDRLPK